MPSLLAFPLLALAQANSLLSVDVSGSVSLVGSWMSQAAASVGFRVTGSQDLAARLRGAGHPARDLVVFDVCHASTAASVLSMAPDLAALLPCRIAVQGSEGRVRVISARPSALATFVPVNESVRAAASKVDESIEGILQELKARSDFEAAWAEAAAVFRQSLAATKGNRPDANGLIRQTQDKWSAMPVPPAFYRASWPSIRSETNAHLDAALRAVPGEPAHEALEEIRSDWARHRGALGYLPYEDLLSRFHDAMEAATEAKSAPAELERLWQEAMEAPRRPHPRETERTQARQAVESALREFRADPANAKLGAALRGAFARFFVPFG